MKSMTIALALLIQSLSAFAADPAPSPLCGFSSWISAGMMAKLDANGDGRLDVQETLAGFPQFAGILQERFNAEWIAKAAYTFTMKYQHVPSKDVAGVMQFESWIAITPFWTYELTADEVSAAVNAMLCPAS